MIRCDQDCNLGSSTAVTCVTWQRHVHVARQSALQLDLPIPKIFGQTEAVASITLHILRGNMGLLRKRQSLYPRRTQNRSVCGNWKFTNLTQLPLMRCQKQPSLRHQGLRKYGTIATVAICSSCNPSQACQSLANAIQLVAATHRGHARTQHAKSSFKFKPNRTLETGPQSSPGALCEATLYTTSLPTAVPRM